MPAFATARVAAVTVERPGLQRIELDNGRRAYVLTQLTGTVAVGDRVVVNTTAVDLGLGTGGWDVVHWNLERESWAEPGPGHIMKLRYTSLQVDTGAAEESGPPTPRDSLAGAPVIACFLHSQVAVAAAVLHNVRPDARIAYVMTDSGSLPLVLSDLVPALVDRGVITTTVTAGHAFGGDHEAVNTASAIEVAFGTAGADVTVVGPGPGVVGTGGGLGFSGLEVASTIDATARLLGTPVVAVRASSADRRDRHRGISHHTASALRMASNRARVPVPAGQSLPWPVDHDVVPVELPDVAAILDGLGVTITTMGRAYSADPLFFDFAAAAGAHVATMPPASVAGP